jgi:hypothetical protein
MTTKLEPYLSDERVQRVAEKLYGEYPILKRYPTDFATARIEAPWHGQLPDGSIGWTEHPVVQFVVVSDHPRPLQRRMGVRHASTGSVWPAAFEATEKEESTYIIGERTEPPEERIFRALVMKHIVDLDRLSRIENDAIGHPSGLKSYKEAL